MDNYFQKLNGINVNDKTEHRKRALSGADARTVDEFPLYEPADQQGTGRIYRDPGLPR